MDSKFEMRKDIRDIEKVCRAMRQDIVSSFKGKIKYGNENYALWKKLIDNFTDKYKIKEKYNDEYRIFNKYWYSSNTWTLDIHEYDEIYNALKVIIEAEGLQWFEKIFISHCEGDAKSVNLFVELLNKIGIPIPSNVNQASIFCSSNKAYNIKIGEDNKTRIKKELQAKDKNVLFILWYTPKYFESISCLNEMGAIWALDKQYYQILIPNFDSDNIGGLLSEEPTWIRADDKDGLNDLKNILINKFLLPNIEENYWEHSRDEYINRLYEVLD